MSVPTVRTVAAISATALFVVGQLYATLPLLGALGNEFNVSAGAAAWTASVFGFAYAIGMLVSGPLSDQFERKRVAISGLLAVAVASAVVALAPTFSMLLVSRALQGFTAAFFPPAMLAYLTERIDQRHRSASLTIVISSFLSAAIAAPLAAQALASLGGWRIWFEVSTPCLLLLAMLLSRVLRPDGVRPRSASVAVQLARLPGLLRNPWLDGLFLTTAVVMWAYVGVTTLAQLAGPGTANNPAMMQWVRLATLPACVAVPLLAPLLGLAPSRIRLLSAVGVIAVAVAAAGLATGPYGLAVALAALTAGVAACAPALVETIAQTSPVHQRGSATAMYGCMLFVGASLAGPTAAAFQHLGFFYAAGGFVAVLVIGWLSATAATR